MKQITFILVFFTLLADNIYSQSDFRTGYVLKNDNDTIWGLIDYRGNKANAKYCLFKKDIDSEELKFAPNDIKAYRFIGSKFYISRIVNTGEKDDLIFLEYLINGTVDIFYYRDNLGEHYLIDRGDGRLLPLKNEEREVYVNGTKRIRDSKEYIGILKYIFQESPSVSKKVENIDLDHKSLISIAKEYNTEVCKDGDCIIYEKALPKSRIIIGPMIGVNVNYISLNHDFDDAYYYLKNSSFNVELFPTIGLFCKVGLPFINEKLYFQYEITYSKNTLKTNNSYRDSVMSSLISYNKIVLTQHSISNSVLLRYEFPKGKLRPSFNAGLFIHNFFNTNFKRNLELKWLNGNVYYKKEFTENPFSQFEGGLRVGVGAIGKVFNNRELMVDLNYQRGIGLFDRLYTNTFLLNFCIQIGK